MIRRSLPAGDRALLLETGDTGSTMAVCETIRAAGLAEVRELVPAFSTVLVTVAKGTDLTGFTERLLDLAAGAGSAGPDDTGREPLVIPVRYDGPDLPDVLELTGLTLPELVRAHTGRPWRAGFVGFAPGFAYLVGGDPRLNVPRRPQSRTRVPAGSVALAGAFSAVYPRPSPGGWQLVGHTDMALWDERADPPATIRPGRWVRFVDATVAPPTRPMAAPSGRAGRGAAVTAGLTVIRPGPQSLFQDGGRPGHAADGVGLSGAADRGSFRAANLLVGNDPGAVTIECTLGGLTVRAERDLVVALAGAPAPAEVDGTAVEHATAVRITAGQRLRLRAPRTGLRTYLAVAGGFDVPPVLGSASTDTLSHLGPAPLAGGDVLPVVDAGPTGAAARREPPATVLDESMPTLRVLLGPRDDWFVDPRSLAEGHWLVSPQSNRVGLRLDRPEPGPDGSARPGLQRRIIDEIPSEGIALGSLQVPPSGQPVLFLADHPLTGGYPVVAVVADDDIDRAAQLRPGQPVRFRVGD